MHCAAALSRCVPVHDASGDPERRLLRAIVLQARDDVARAARLQRDRNKLAARYRLLRRSVGPIATRKNWRSRRSKDRNQWSEIEDLGREALAFLHQIGAHT